MATIEELVQVVPVGKLPRLVERSKTAHVLPDPGDTSNIPSERLDEIRSSWAEFAVDPNEFLTDTVSVLTDYLEDQSQLGDLGEVRIVVQPGRRGTLNVTWLASLLPAQGVPGGLAAVHARISITEMGTDTPEGRPPDFTADVDPWRLELCSSTGLYVDCYPGKLEASKCADKDKSTLTKATEEMCASVIKYMDAYRGVIIDGMMRAVVRVFWGKAQGLLGPKK